MKVAMIGLRGIPAKSGGVEHAVMNLAPRLAQMGVKVTVYCRTPYCEERPMSWKGVSLRYIPTINRKHTEAPVHTLLCTIDAIREGNDIIHFHALGNGFFSFIPRLFRKKTVVTVHGLDYKREKWGAAAKTFLRLSEKISFHADKVIAVSKSIAEQYEGQARVRYIPNGVEKGKMRKLAGLLRFGLKEGEYILFLGRLVPEKGVHLLIKAFRNIDYPIKLVIAGEATHTEEYVRHLKKIAGTDNRIIFTGPLYGRDKEEAFSNCRLFVLPSTLEGMPLALLEALSYKKPVLASDIQENRDASGGSCDYFSSGDCLDLEDRLTGILRQKPKHADFTGFSWENAARDTMEEYCKVA
jgi:glycosyltransferase involved in cell wall biosynthesis